MDFCTKRWDPYGPRKSATSHFQNALRVWQIEYPNGARVGFERGNTSASANANNIDDRLNRVTGLDWDADGAGGTYSDVDEVDYAYNGTGRMVKVDYGVPDVRREMFSSGNDYDRWDRFGRTLTHEWEDYTSGTVTRDQVDYTYDAAGNRLTRDVTASTNDTRDQVYTYDGLHRLKTYDGGTLSGGSISGTPKREQDFTLDQLGNWSSLTDKTNGTINFVDTRTHSDANELLTSSQTEYTALDDAGNMTTVSDPRDFTDGYTLKYDAWNRLVEAKRSSTVVQENEYDGLNRRIVRDETGGSGVVTHFYYNRQWQVAEERVGIATTADKQYIYHPNYVDAVAVRYNASGDAHYYLQDANYNVTAVTDDAGTVKERYSYTPYGEVTILDADFSADADNKSDIGNEYLYTGRRVDPETGLQLNRNRFYHATMGRWVNRDPIEYEAGAYNLYEYVSGMPLIALDPEGLCGSVCFAVLTCSTIPDFPAELARQKCRCICGFFPGDERDCQKRCMKCKKSPKQLLKDPAAACKCFCNLNPVATRGQIKQCEDKCDKIGSCVKLLLNKKPDPKAYCKCICNLMPKKRQAACLQKCNQVPKPPVPPTNPQCTNP